MFFFDLVVVDGFWSPIGEDKWFKSRWFHLAVRDGYEETQCCFLFQHHMISYFMEYRLNGSKWIKTITWIGQVLEVSTFDNQY